MSRVCWSLGVVVLWFLAELGDEEVVVSVTDDMTKNRNLVVIAKVLRANDRYAN